MRDDLVAPLRWNGGAAELRLEYDHESASIEHRGWLELEAAPWLHDRHAHGGALLGIHAGYMLLLEAGRPTPLDLVRLGMASVANVDMTFFYDWDEEHLYWLTVYTLGPALAWKHAWIGAGATIDATLGIPVVGLISRPPTERFTKRDPLEQVLGSDLPEAHRHLRTSWVGDYQAVEARLRFAHPFSTRTGYEIAYSFRFAREANPSPVMLLSHVLSIGMVFR